MRKRPRGRPTGHKLSAESKRKISKSKAGYIMPQVTKDAISASLIIYFAKRRKTMGTKAKKTKNSTKGEKSFVRTAINNPFLEELSEKLKQTDFKDKGHTVIGCSLAKRSINKVQFTNDYKLPNGMTMEIQKMDRIYVSVSLFRFNKPDELDELYEALRKKYKKGTENWFAKTITFPFFTLITKHNGDEFRWEHREVAHELLPSGRRKPVKSLQLIKINGNEEAVKFKDQNEMFKKVGSIAGLVCNRTIESITSEKEVCDI